MAYKIGRDTLATPSCPSVLATAAVGSGKEGDGPLGKEFDLIEADSRFGEQTWEKAESRMQELACKIALGKASRKMTDMDFIFAGDLLNQCIASAYGARSAGVPFIGLYGACSTFTEAMALAAVFVDGGAGKNMLAVASSHFCSAERQYRFPLEYGGQRPPTAQWTATAAGAAVVSGERKAPFIQAVCFGRIQDLGINDQNNMGAAMAPAAASTIKTFLEDTGTKPEDYELILTGDLGKVGSDLLEQLLQKDGIDIIARHQDCGLLLYDREKQQVEAGASGCGCAASVASCHLFPHMEKGDGPKSALVIATGALLSPTSIQQGETIPAVAHLVCFTSDERRLF